MVAEFYYYHPIKDDKKADLQFRERTNSFTNYTIRYNNAENVINDLAFLWKMRKVEIDFFTGYKPSKRENRLLKMFWAYKRNTAIQRGK